MNLKPFSMWFLLRKAQRNKSFTNCLNWIFNLNLMESLTLVYLSKMWGTEEYFNIANIGNVIASQI